jgi:RNA polymerase sigma factor (sigma-70 family)
MSQDQEIKIMSAADLESIRKGNEFVLRKVYKEHYPLIKKMVLANNGDEDDARDIYQEAFIVFYENMRLEDFVLTCSIGTYLYSVARNLWYKKLRSYGKGNTRITEENENEFADVDDSLNFHSQMEKNILHIEVALENLGEPCKTILTDYYFRKLSMQDIAEKMNYTNADNAKNQKYKCFNRLKKRVLEMIQK